MCMVDGLDERASVWNETQRKARKAHMCGECGRDIAVGEVYWYLWATCSDGPFTGKWCEHCNVAKKWLWKECGGSVLTCVHEDIQDHLDEYRGQRLRRLKILDVGMRRRWRVKRGPRAGTIMPLPKLPPLFDVRA